MKTSYAVLWQQADSAAVPGRLAPLPLGFRFTPADESAGEEEVHYEDVAALRIGSAPDDELEGQPTFIVERRAGPSIRIASVAQPSLAAELAHGLAAVALGDELAPVRLLVIVPLKEGEASAARALLHSGPPFTPEQVGLERHEAFLTENEAVFVFETLEGEAVLESLFTSAAVWEAAPAWRQIIAGPPRVAEVIYSWKHGRLGAETEEAAEL